MHTQRYNELMATKQSNKMIFFMPHNMPRFQPFVPEPSTVGSGNTGSNTSSHFFISNWLAIDSVCSEHDER